MTDDFFLRGDLWSGADAFRKSPKGRAYLGLFKADALADPETYLRLVAALGDPAAAGAPSGHAQVRDLWNSATKILPWGEGGGVLELLGPKGFADAAEAVFRSAAGGALDVQERTKARILEAVRSRLFRDAIPIEKVAMAYAAAYAAEVAGGEPWSAGLGDAFKAIVGGTGRFATVADAGARLADPAFLDGNPFLRELGGAAAIKSKIETALSGGAVQGGLGAVPKLQLDPAKAAGVPSPAPDAKAADLLWSKERLSEIAEEAREKALWLQGAAMVVEFVDKDLGRKLGKVAAGSFALATGASELIATSGASPRGWLSAIGGLQTLLGSGGGQDQGLSQAFEELMRSQQLILHNIAILGRKLDFIADELSQLRSLTIDFGTEILARLGKVSDALSGLTVRVDGMYRLIEGSFDAITHQQWREAAIGLLEARLAQDLLALSAVVGDRLGPPLSDALAAAYAAVWNDYQAHLTTIRTHLVDLTDAPFNFRNVAFASAPPDFRNSPGAVGKLLDAEPTDRIPHLADLAEALDADGASTLDASAFKALAHPERLRLLTAVYVQALLRLRSLGMTDKFAADQLRSANADVAGKVWKASEAVRSLCGAVPKLRHALSVAVAELKAAASVEFARKAAAVAGRMRSYDDLLSIQAETEALNAEVMFLRLAEIAVDLRIFTVRYRGEKPEKVGDNPAQQSWWGIFRHLLYLERVPHDPQHHVSETPLTRVKLQIGPPVAEKALQGAVDTSIQAVENGLSIAHLGHFDYPNCSLGDNGLRSDERAAQLGEIATIKAAIRKELSRHFTSEAERVKAAVKAKMARVALLYGALIAAVDVGIGPFSSTIPSLEELDAKRLPRELRPDLVLEAEGESFKAKLTAMADALSDLPELPAAPVLKAAVRGIEWGVDGYASADGAMRVLAHALPNATELDDFRRDAWA